MYGREGRVIHRSAIGGAGKAGEAYPRIPGPGRGVGVMCWRGGRQGVNDIVVGQREERGGGEGRVCI